MRTVTRSTAVLLACLSSLAAVTACGNQSSDSGAGSQASTTSTSSTSASSAGAGAQSSSSSTTATSPTRTSSATSSGTSTSSSAASSSASSAQVSASPQTPKPVAPQPTAVTKSEVAKAPVSTVRVTTPAGGPSGGAVVTAQALTTFTNGLTMSFTYSADGKQHLYRAQPENTVVASPNSQGVVIDFGDGSDPAGADLGAMQCLPNSPLAAFSDKLPQQTHTYTKPGTYTVTTTTYFCGDAGVSSKATTQQVTVR